MYEPTDVTSSVVSHPSLKGNGYLWTARAVKVDDSSTMIPKASHSDSKSQDMRKRRTCRLRVYRFSNDSV